MFVAMVTNWLTCLLKRVKMAAAHEQKKQNVKNESRQWTTTELRCFRSPFRHLFINKTKDNPVSKSAFLSRESNFNKSNCPCAIFVDHTSAHSLREYSFGTFSFQKDIFCFW